jgi:riboflavin synthase alpha subunit
MKLNERLGGHLVAGHVDGIGTVRTRLKKIGDCADRFKVQVKVGHEETGC